MGVRIKGHEQAQCQWTWCYIKGHEQAQCQWTWCYIKGHEQAQCQRICYIKGHEQAQCQWIYDVTLRGMNRHSASGYMMLH